MSSTGSPQGFPNINQPIAAPNGFITRPWLQLMVAFWNRTGAATGGSIVPTGTVVHFAGPAANIPGGWIACGQTVSKTTFPNLFAAILYTWGGSGDNFALPPQDGFIKGVGSDHVGSTGGAATVAVAVANLPAHNHPVVDPGHTHVITDPGHVHASLVADSINTTGTATGATQAGNTAIAMTGITNNPATTGITTGNTGGATPISTMPPYAVLLKIIKT
jgi:microcystin-dependent protein